MVYRNAKKNTNNLLFYDKIQKIYIFLESNNFTNKTTLNKSDDYAENLLKSVKKCANKR